MAFTLYGTIVKWICVYKNNDMLTGIMVIDSAVRFTDKINYTINNGCCAYNSICLIVQFIGT